MTDNSLANLWKGKKVAALVLTLLVVIGTMFLNKNYDLGIDVEIIFAILGLNTIYILRQGSIDSKKSNKNAFKPFWESRKFLAVFIGNIAPLFVEAINKKYETGITSEIILGLIGVDTVYMLRQGALDAKEPDSH